MLCVGFKGPVDSEVTIITDKHFGWRCPIFCCRRSSQPSLHAYGSETLTVVLIFPFSVVMLSLWCRCAKGLAAPQDSKYRVMRTDALILAPSRVWRGLKRCWGLRRSPLGGETASRLVLQPPPPSLVLLQRPWTKSMAFSLHSKTQLVKVVGILVDNNS